MTSGGVVGVLLAGGRSSRMGGGDKSLRPLGGRPILERIVERVRGQVGELIINANGDAARFAAYGLTVVADVVEGYAGPLAGVLTGLEWMRANRPEVAWLATFATDAPFVPRDLVPRLADAVAGDRADMACAASGGQIHPVFGLWPVRLAGDLAHALRHEDMRKIDRWTARYRIAHVAFATEPFDPFFNINEPENLAEAEHILAAFDEDTAPSARREAGR
ncbi:MAG: molybdenum cofactor guanylyltransferase MobA [Rhodospirillales bacterium]|nr:molybdenum cofactor guanylyltransferase MobA [Rhodospirillales bacterium]